MDRHEIDYIVKCLPKDRTILHYFRDRYALELLASYADSPKAIREVKQSPFAGLLNKPVVQQVAKSCADGMLTRDRLRSYWPANPTAFVLSLGYWGSTKRSDYYQTSRTGYNLVLQLNFSNQHNGPYSATLDPRKESPFAYMDHPVNKRGRNTLAWARMDIDLERGEALIEEIQNDWLRNARLGYRWLIFYLSNQTSWNRMKDQWFDDDAYRPVKNHKVMLRYFEKCVLPYEKLWDEAMLYAALWFLREELGIERIFYNTWDTGCRMKGLEFGSKPPRSIYTALPKKFCMQQTDEHPDFIAHRVRTVRWKHGDIPMKWFRLNL